MSDDQNEPVEVDHPFDRAHLEVEADQAGRLAALIGAGHCPRCGGGLRDALVQGVHGRPGASMWACGCVPICGFCRVAENLEAFNRVHGFPTNTYLPGSWPLPYVDEFQRRIEAAIIELKSDKLGMFPLSADDE